MFLQVRHQPRAVAKFQTFWKGSMWLIYALDEHATVCATSLITFSSANLPWARCDQGLTKKDDYLFKYLAPLAGFCTTRMICTHSSSGLLRHNSTATKKPVLRTYHHFVFLFFCVNVYRKKGASQMCAVMNQILRTIKAGLG